MRRERHPQKYTRQTRQLNFILALCVVSFLMISFNTWVSHKDILPIAKMLGAHYHYAPYYEGTVVFGDYNQHYTFMLGNETQARIMQRPRPLTNRNQSAIKRTLEMVIPELNPNILSYHYNHSCSKTSLLRKFAHKTRVVRAVPSLRRNFMDEVTNDAYSSSWENRSVTVLVNMGACRSKFWLKEFLPNLMRCRFVDAIVINWWNQSSEAPDVSNLSEVYVNFPPCSSLGCRFEFQSDFFRSPFVLSLDDDRSVSCEDIGFGAEHLWTFPGVMWGERRLLRGMNIKQDYSKIAGFECVRYAYSNREKKPESVPFGMFMSSNAMYSRRLLGWYTNIVPRALKDLFDRSCEDLSLTFFQMLLDDRGVPRPLAGDNRDSAKFLLLKREYERPCAISQQGSYNEDYRSGCLNLLLEVYSSIGFRLSTRIRRA